MKRSTIPFPTHIKLQNDAQTVGGEGEEHAEESDDHREYGVSEEGLRLVLSEEGRLDHVPGHETLDGVRQENGEAVDPPAGIHKVIGPAVVLEDIA